MTYIETDSSQITKFAHDPATNTLHVHFRRGGYYTYADFPAEKFELMKVALSHGKFLGAEIKGKHAFTKIS